MTASITQQRQQALEKRYGMQMPNVAGADWPPLLSALLLEWRSTRAFLDLAVSDDELRTVVAAAQSAATSSNLQAWSVVTVREAALKARLAGLVGKQRHIEQAPLRRVFVADLRRPRALEDYVGSPATALDYFESFVAAIIDIALTGQNAATAALGLGRCFIGAMHDHPEQVANALALPPESIAVLGLLVGWPDPAVASEVKIRLAGDIVRHIDQYQPFDSVAPAGYDGVMRRSNEVSVSAQRTGETRPLRDEALERGRRISAANRRDKAAERVSGPEALGGRRRLLDAGRACSFRLK